ncbi:hypothetical protein llap_21638 [Limosa lapponica baueri]|uniref:Uncharacterized protein n=1 Tax=Limosa lapponica baueri TaxID=1758121 RepID=A0A2I0T2P3_LIMLA|nr:hypothetical protein llap_21638 [Limosa lapponica baueri]
MEKWSPRQPRPPPTNTLKRATPRCREQHWGVTAAPLLAGQPHWQGPTRWPPGQARLQLRRKARQETRSLKASLKVALPWLPLRARRQALAMALALPVPPPAVTSTAKQSDTSWALTPAMVARQERMAVTARSRPPSWAPRM